MLRRILSIVLITVYTWPPLSAGQSGSAAAAAAGASLAASASQSGASTSANAASAPGGASSAPIEVQIMVYGGLKQIARHIADDTATALREGKLTQAVFSDATTIADKALLDVSESGWKCTEETVGSVLLQDSTSSAQIALYKTFDSYSTTLSGYYKKLIAILSGARNEEAAKRKAELEDLQERLKATQDKLQALQNQLKNQSQGRAPQIKPNALQPALGVLGETQQNLAAMSSNVGALAAETAAETATATTPGPGGGGSGGGGSGQPLSLQYLSGIGGELTAAKSNMSYASSSVQALSQALTTELGKDLCHDKIQLRTATTTLNLDDAAAEIAQKWETLQEESGHLTRLLAWLQRPVKDTSGNDTSKPVPDSQQLIATSDGVALGSSLSNAMTALQTWMTGSDQMGGIILTDILKGAQLSKDFNEKKFPALQVSIDAAGGNTRTNSFPLFNFFYLPKPSFNAGVVVTYELRDEANNFLAGDTKKVIYAYSKWKPEAFCMDETVDTVDLDSGRQPASQPTNGTKP
jgi:hypothetical protein